MVLVEARADEWCSGTNFEKVVQASEQGQTQEWLEQHPLAGLSSWRKQGVALPAWLAKSQSKGAIFAKEGGKLGTDDHFAALWQQTKAWFQQESRQGHTLFAEH